MNKQQPSKLIRSSTKRKNKDRTRERENKYYIFYGSYGKTKNEQNTTANDTENSFQDIYQNFIYFPLVAYDFKENEIKCIFDTCKWHIQLQQQRENRTLLCHCLHQRHQHPHRLAPHVILCMCLCMPMWNRNHVHLCKENLSYYQNSYMRRI